MRGLGTVIHQECWVFPTLAHVDGTEVQGALNTATFVENDGERLLDTSGAHFHDLVIFLARAIHSKFLNQVFRLGAGHTQSDWDDLVWLDIKLGRFYGETRFWAGLFLELDKSCDAAFIFEVNLLVAGLTVRNETHVDKGLELDVCSGLEGV